MLNPIYMYYTFGNSPETAQKLHKLQPGLQTSTVCTTTSWSYPVRTIRRSINRCIFPSHLWYEQLQ